MGVSQGSTDARKMADEEAAKTMVDDAATKPDEETAAATVSDDTAAVTIPDDRTSQPRLDEATEVVPTTSEEGSMIVDPLVELAASDAETREEADGDLTEATRSVSAHDLSPLAAAAAARNGAMRIPHTIPASALRVYEPSAESSGLKGGEEARTVRAENFGWNLKVPPKLTYWCILAIARNFHKNPSDASGLPLCDYDHLLELLATDLPLELTVPLVPDGVYWQRCCEDKWDTQNYVMEYGNSWKRMFLERYLEEYLEKMAVEDYKVLEVIALAHLVSPHVKRLRLRELQLIKSPQELDVVASAEAQVERKKAEEEEEIVHIEPAAKPPVVKPTSASSKGSKGKGKGAKDKKKKKKEEEPEAQPEPPKPRPLTPPSPDEPLADLPDPCVPRHDVPLDHINLEPVLKNLKNLQDFSIIYAVRDCGMDYRHELFKFSLHDVKNLAAGLQETLHLRIFRITRSNLDDTLSPDLIRGLVNVPRLRVLDLSHCRVGDRTACALGHVLNNHKRLELLDLTNNCIGPKGAKGLAYALQQQPCAPLKELHLRLNGVGDDGAAALASTLERAAVPTTLGLAACGVTAHGVLQLALALRRNGSLRHLDLSNNSLGNSGGEHLEAAMKMNNTLTDLDIRMTDIPAFREYVIMVEVWANHLKYRRLFAEIQDILKTGSDTKSFSERSSVQSVDNSASEDVIEEEVVKDFDKPHQSKIIWSL